jgi:hypothetical protein
VSAFAFVLAVVFVLAFAFLSVIPAGALLLHLPLPVLPPRSNLFALSSPKPAFAFACSSSHLNPTSL